MTDRDEELLAEGMSEAAIAHTAPPELCGVREGIDGGTCVYLPHTGGRHSWEARRLVITDDEGPRIGGSYGQ